MKLETISVEYVPVGAEDRFEAIMDGRIDLLCGATSVTIRRRAMIDFSIPTFIDGASVMFSADGPDGFEGLAGQDKAMDKHMEKYNLQDWDDTAPSPCRDRSP